MLFIAGDKLSDDNPLIILFSVLGIVGLVDISQEIIQQNSTILSSNMIKKILLFSVIYMKTQSIYNTSLVCIIVFLLFPVVFFGEPTNSKKVVATQP
jgi:hypothetical protein